MLVYKRWEKKNRIDRVTHLCDGWFLFGLIPVYIRRVEV